MQHAASSTTPAQVTLYDTQQEELARAATSRPKERETITNIPKYRAWHKTEHKMFEVYRLSWFHGIFLIGDKDSDNGLRFGSGEVELMEYLPFEDRNGKQICEGDILQDMWGVCQEAVRFTDETHVMTGFMFRRIKFKGDLSTERTVTFRSWLQVATIVGNIYENPNLL